MAVKDKIQEKFEWDCRIEKNWPPASEGKFNRDLFGGDWEFFVVKRDQATGKMVGRFACCALARV